MENEANQHEPSSPETGSNPDLLTVSQAYHYLTAEGLPRSKKTIRKWCRFNHVDWKEIAVPGGAKWLITKSSLDARIAEERLIDASLVQGTGANPPGQARTDTDANPSTPARDDAMIDLLKEQLAHERDARTVAEAKNRDMIDKYHEISLASAQMGIEIGKGMQEQARIRRLAVQSEREPDRPVEPPTGSRMVETTTSEKPRQGGPTDIADPHRDGDNPTPGLGGDAV